MAETLIRLHMSSDWIWTPETRDPTYLKIIQKFEDKRNAPYSIHQIAQMGSSEGKPIGEWFGPNTVAQVLKLVKSEIQYIDFKHYVLESCPSRTVGVLWPYMWRSTIYLSWKKCVSVFLCLLCNFHGNLFNWSVEIVVLGQICLGHAERESSVYLRNWKPLLLIIPLRLGLTEINKIYYRSFQVSIKSTENDRA